MLAPPASNWSRNRSSPFHFHFERRSARSFCSARIFTPSLNSPVSLPHCIGRVRSTLAVSIVLVVFSNFSSTASISKTPLS